MDTFYPCLKRQCIGVSKVVIYLGIVFSLWVGLLTPAQAALVVQSGANQIIPTNQISAPIVFKATDLFGNPVTGLAVTLTVNNLNPPASFVMQPANGKVDGQGLISIQYATPPLDLPAGTYNIRASAVISGVTNAISTTLQLFTPLPPLPNLRTCLDLTGNPTQAQCFGGVAVNGASYTNPTTLKLADTVLVTGAITVNPVDLGATADILVIALYTDPSGSFRAYYMLNSQGAPVLWNETLPSLVAFKSGVVLPATYRFDMYNGRFVATGNLDVYIGYRLANGNVIWNGQQAMGITIN